MLLLPFSLHVPYQLPMHSQIFPSLFKSAPSGFSLSSSTSGGLMAVDYFLNRDGTRVTLGEGGFGMVRCESVLRCAWHAAHSCTMHPLALSHSLFAQVYKGKLLDGTTVAIKALKRYVGPSGGEELEKAISKGGSGSTDLDKGSGKGVSGSSDLEKGIGKGSSKDTDGLVGEDPMAPGTPVSKPQKPTKPSMFGSLFSSVPAVRRGSVGSGSGSGTGSGGGTGSGRSGSDVERRASAAAEESKKLTRQLVDEAAILQQCDHECLVHFLGERVRVGRSRDNMRVVGRWWGGRRGGAA